MPIHRNSNLPLYAQLTDTLRDRIESGELAVGMQLPSEQELCQAYGVSRTVVRQALNDLHLAGLIRKQRGKNTFVAGAKLEQTWVNKIAGFYQYMAEKGHVLVTHVLGQELIPANAQIASYLNISQGVSVIWIKRLRFVDGEPIQLVDSYVPYAVCPDLLNEDLTNQSLTAYLESKGLVGTKGRRTLESISANEYQAQLLQIEKGAPLTLLDAVFCVSDGTAIAYSKAVYRGDRTRFEVDLVRIAKYGPSP